MPKLSACIVAYCDYDEVCAAVRSILHYTPRRILRCTWWITPALTAAARSWPPRIFGDARVTVIQLAENIGFGKGTTPCWSVWTARCIFILNPDILLTGDILDGLADWLLTQNGAAMATPPAVLPGRPPAAPALPQTHAVAAAGTPAGAEVSIASI